MTRPLPTSGEGALRQALRRWRLVRDGSAEVEGVNDAPACVFGMMTREMMDSLAGDVEDIKAEIQWIRRVIVTAVVGAAIATVLRFMGWAP